MTKQERLLRIAGLMTILRDDLEEMNFDKVLKNKTNIWLKHANIKMRELAGGDEESNEQLIKIVQHFDNILRLDGGG